MEDGRFRMVIGRLGKDEAGRKKVEITDVSLNNLDRLKHIEKKLIDQGVLKLERHPGDGLPRNRRQPKSGYGGKFTWEGPRSLVDHNELFDDDVPSAMDKGDPNYVDEEEEEEEEEWEEFNYVDEEDWEEDWEDWEEEWEQDWEEELIVVPDDEVDVAAGLFVGGEVEVAKEEEGSS